MTKVFRFHFEFLAAMNLAEQHADNLAEFTDTLMQSRFWHVLPAGETDLQNAVGFLDTRENLYYPSAAILGRFLRDHPFVFVKSFLENASVALLQSANKLLWGACEGTRESAQHPQDSDFDMNSIADVSNGFLSAFSRISAELATSPHVTAKFNQALGILDRTSHEKGKEIVKAGKWGGLSNWRLPTKSELIEFSQGKTNPYRSGKGLGLLTTKGRPSAVWLTAMGSCNLESSSGIKIEPGGAGTLLPLNEFWANATPEEMLADLCHRAWYLVEPNGQTIMPDRRFCGLSIEKLQAALVIEHYTLTSAENTDLTLSPGALWIDTMLSELDYTPCRLPVLSNAQLTDPEKGLWELWGEAEEASNRFAIIARDPGRDIQRRAVAIDFGTSSTVVACETSSGGRELLRIGVRDFYQAVQPQHFENPTVLECLDFASFQQAWTSQAYRPKLNWNWMRAAHEAQASFRDNPGDTRILASILPRLKQWALRDSEHRRVRLTDRLGHEIELPLHSERNPLRGQALQVNINDPFDPIELYAWHLGMAINWRERGLFLKYYLSFPVKYPLEVRDRILASFRRGLQRSLPHSLVSHHPEALNEFDVNELASEPAAYAAAALEHLGVKPDDIGVPYAVFDFGGGTTDFDFGLLRWANEEEEENGYEQVFEHLASSGDNFLGGENLLEHLVYETFRNNLDVLRAGRIQFTLPLDAQPFSGSEAFIARTQAAQTNTVMLAARLRSFMEGDSTRLDPQIKLDLLDADGNGKTCELILDAEHLDTFLAERMRRGVEAFLAELANARSQFPSNSPVHILLAGNGSRSRHINTLFDTGGNYWPDLLHAAFGENSPEIIIHPPLPIDDANPHAPTSKTGVALGLLRVSPGRNILLQNHVHASHNGQAPFAWFVGRLRRGCLEPTLTPSICYGEWKVLGPLQSGVFYLYATTSPRAHIGLQEGDPELEMHRLEFPAAAAGAKVHARAVAPHLMELSAFVESDDPSELDVRRIELG